MPGRRRKKLRQAARKRREAPVEETILDEGPPVPRGGDGYLKDIRGGEFKAVGTSKVNLKDYLDAVYERVGGSKAAVAIAKQYGWSIDPKTLDRDLKVHDTNRLNPRGEYDPSKDEVALSWRDKPGVFTGNKGVRSADAVLDTLRHELDHAINRGTQDDDAANLVDTRSLDERVDAITKSADSLEDYKQLGSKDPFRRYMGTVSEVRARALRLIKHWGAEKLGVLPKNRAEARDLINKYYEAEMPMRSRSRDPAELDMWRNLMGTVGIEDELLRTVDANKQSGVA